MRNEPNYTRMVFGLADDPICAAGGEEETNQHPIECSASTELRHKIIERAFLSDKRTIQDGQIHRRWMVAKITKPIAYFGLSQLSCFYV